MANQPQSMAVSARDSDGLRAAPQPTLPPTTLTSKERSDFILSAINDAQSTIRALDHKAAAMLVVLAFPLTIVPHILTLETDPFDCLSRIINVSLLLGMILWTVSIVFS